jgi:hypothetical protein
VAPGVGPVFRRGLNLKGGGSAGVEMIHQGNGRVSIVTFNIACVKHELVDDAQKLRMNFAETLRVSDRC